MSDCVRVQYTIDGTRASDGLLWETYADQNYVEAGLWSPVAEEIASEHYEVYGALGDIVEIAIYRYGECRATVKLEKYQPIVRYQAIEVGDEED